MLKYSRSHRSHPSIINKNVILVYRNSSISVDILTYYIYKAMHYVLMDDLSGYSSKD